MPWRLVSSTTAIKHRSSDRKLLVLLGSSFLCERIRRRWLCAVYYKRMHRRGVQTSEARLHTALCTRASMEQPTVTDPHAVAAELSSAIQLALPWRWRSGSVDLAVRQSIIIAVETYAAHV